MNIYIAGLNFSTTEADLNDLFSEYGEVSSTKIILGRETGKSRGFAFVEMSDDSAAQKAIDELNGAEFDKKTISVNIARPREERPSNRGNHDRRGGCNSRRY